MILEVQHETRLEYLQPVSESMVEVRMEPASDADQSCRSFHLNLTPATEYFRYQDGFGNRVHHFNLLAAHQQVRILAASIVETHPRHREVTTSLAAHPLDLTSADLEVLDYLSFRGPVRTSPRLSALLDRLKPRPGMKLAELVQAVMGHIRARFEYAPDVTHASSPVDDVLELGKGVCQDFAHLVIAVLRSFGVPARYVSGYIHRPNKQSQSHAWCELWLPDLGWLGIDPTNDQVVDDRFIRVAVGRDFTDVPPNKGIYRGLAVENMYVRVETRLLERLPSLSWQEELPPLHVPLTASAPRVRLPVPRSDEYQDQQ
jgi:transglutaminase-like putative cysteine protease